MNKNHERGVALVLSLFLMSAMSVLAASLMFLSQTETYASMNYRMMSQSRYGGEAAVHKAADFLLDLNQYQVPKDTNTLDPLSNYNTLVSPVEYMGEPVVLSSLPASEGGKDSNYPASSVQTAFDAAAQGALTAGNVQVEYSAYATLVSMRAFTTYGGEQAVVQTWEITGIGELSGARSATVEVVATVETPKVPANNYAAFATDQACGSLYFHGNVTTNSYDSRYGPPGSGPGNSTQDTGGDIGTNGNFHIEGSVEVQGNVYTPRTGVGACTEEQVVGLDEDASSMVTGSVFALPTLMTYTVPPITAPYNATVEFSTDVELSDACANLALASASVVLAGPNQNCFFDVATNTLTLGADGVSGEISLPNIEVGNNYTLVFQGNSSPSQIYNVNSLSGRGNIEINANTDAGDSNEAVVLKVAGLDTDGMTELAVVLDLDEMAWKQNSTATSYDASAFQIIYGGSGTITMTGGNMQSAVTVYAPNSDFELQGTQDLFGSVLSGTLEIFGNAGLSYDRRLANGFYVVGWPMLSTFTWKRF